MRKLKNNKFMRCWLVVCGFLIFSASLYGQEVYKNNNCEDNLSRLHNILPLRNDETKIIVIARNGVNEKSSNYSLRRLNEMRRAVGDERGVFAIGEKAKGNPQVEIYINGKLELIFEVKNKEKLKVGNCGN